MQSVAHPKQNCMDMVIWFVVHLKLEMQCLAGSSHWVGKIRLQRSPSPEAKRGRDKVSNIGVMERVRIENCSFG
jgi:hypothetical protein